MGLVYIYTLVDPKTNEIKYIGKTNNIELRLYTHTVKSSLLKNNLRTAWIKSLKKQGLTPIIEELDCVNELEWKFWEKHYISLFKSWGFTLKNMTNGGDGNTCPYRTKEFKDKVSLKLKGRKTYIRTTETNLKLSISQKMTYKKGRISNITPEILAKAKEKWIKPVIQLDKNMLSIKEYNSIKDVNLQKGYSSGNISVAIKKGCQAYGFYWKAKSKEICNV
jgi:hypothetical protein